MKKIKASKNISAMLLIFILSSFSPVKSQIRKIENNSFQKGEKLVYNVSYDSFLTGKVKAGECSFEIKEESREIAKRQTMHIIVEGQTKGIFNLFFKVKDRYETFLDIEAIMPWLFIRRVNEGGYTISHDVVFNHYNNTTLFKNLKRGTENTSKIEPYTQDLLSSIYYFRTIDFTNSKVGDGYPIMFTLDDTVYTTNVFYMGKEKVKTQLGTFDCFKLKPMVLEGNVFKDPFPMMIWITDDENKIPILAESALLVGSIKMELASFSGTKRPIKGIKKKR